LVTANTAQIAELAVPKRLVLLGYAFRAFMLGPEKRWTMPE